MRKAWYLPLIAMALTSCNNSETTIEQEISEGTVRKFLSVNILAPISGTRDVNVNPDDYEDGSSSENQINSVRFFFFDAAGNPSEVRKQGNSSTYLSYIDWIPTDSDIENRVPSQTVEKILTATLGINQPATSSLPGLVLAVLNPTQEILSISENPSLSTILSFVNDYQTGLADNNFVITNSVYVGEDVEGKPNLVTATELTEDNFESTEDEASQNSVNIFVERVLARLDLSIGMSPIETENNGNIYQLGGEKTYSIDGGTAAPMYVKLLGWNVTATTTTSRLVKSINVKWPSDIFGDLEPWNISQLHRSFWAINPEEVAYQYGPFTTEEGEEMEPNTADGLPIPEKNSVTTVYLQENANPYSTGNTAADPTTPSKVILAAQLVDENGEPQDLIRWANRYYTEEGALNAITNSLNLYTPSTVYEGTQYDKITPDDLDFVSAQEIYPDGLPEEVSDYFVYVQLSKDGTKKTWYNGNTSSSKAFTTEQANEYLLNIINNLLYWNSGYTYYYLDIYHLGAEGSAGYVGVVRNHIYKANVTGIAGLGTPVYEPDLTIEPEMPGYDDNVLSADIRILQWRVVSQPYNFVWP